jgi:hypothetical protein
MMRGIKRLWESPTFTSWVSMGVRAGGFVILLPILAARLPKVDFEFWLLLANATALILMATFGFDATFVRLIAYARAGRSIEEMRDLASRVDRTYRPVNEEALRRIILFLRKAFLIIALLGLLLALTVGTLALYPAVARSTSQWQSWLSWLLVSAGCAANLYGINYSCILQGFDRIAMLRRWEAIFGLGTMTATIVTVWLSSNLLSLVLVWQLGGLVGILRNRWLACRISEVQKIGSGDRRSSDPELWRTAWPVAWRSGVTTLGSHGLIQASGIIYSLMPNPRQLAGYLLCVRLSQFLYALASVPFQSHVPLMARLRAEGQLTRQLEIAGKVMRRVYGSAILGVLGVGLTVNLVLAGSGSEVRVDPRVWWTFGLALNVQLYGGMLGGLYVMSNRVFGHLAIIVFGLSYYGSGLALTPVFGDIGAAAALFIGCAAAATYAGYKTYPALKVQPWAFERTVTAPAFAATACGFIVAWTMSR